MSNRARQVAMRHRIDMAMLNFGTKAGFDPHQVRDPHTGEWIDAPGVSDIADVFEEYQGDGAFWVNRMLRGQDMTGIEDHPVYNDAELRSLVDRVDGALERIGPLGKSERVFRGVAGSPSDYGLEEGATVTDEGFGSTSADQSVARDAFEKLGEDGFVLDVTVDPDVRAAWMNRVFPGELWAHEKELLLERGVRYVVLGIEGNRVRVRVLSPK